MRPQRIYISREEYVRMTGAAYPDVQTIGATWYSADGKAPLVEYLFSDQKEIEELERLFSK